MKSVLIEIETNVLNWIKDYVSEYFNDKKILDELETWDNVRKSRFTDVERMSKRIHLPFGNFVLNSPSEESKIIIEFNHFLNHNSLSLELSKSI